MPSKSKKQARLMAAVAHNPKFAKKVGIPQSVGREFHAADKQRGRYAGGGKVQAAGRINKLLKESPQFALHRWSAEQGLPENSVFYDEILHNEQWDPDINPKDLRLLVDYSEGLYEDWGPDQTRRLDELIKKHGIRPRNYNTWRGLELDPDYVSSLRPGDKIVRDMASSVSVNKNVADAFANQGARGENKVPTLLRIAPNERLALPMPFSGQSELLMPSGEAGRMWVDKINRGKDSARLDVEVLGPHPGFAEGGKVLPSSKDEEESWSDTYVKRPLSGLASMWGGTDPDTGEFVSPAWHNIKRAWNADERRRQGLPPQERSTLGLVDETVSLPALGGLVGLPVPEFAQEAEDRASTTREAARNAIGVDEPHGFTENLMESAGVMAGQLPVPSSVANKLKLLKESGALGKMGKVLGPAVEWFSPTVVPKAANYLKGALFGGALGGGLDYAEDYMDEREQQERNKQFISEAIAEVLEEERQKKAQESGSDETDDEALAELGYAEGGKVSVARRALSSLRESLDIPEDKELRQAKIDEALRKITTPGTVELPKTIRAGLNEQRDAPGLRNLIDRALPLMQPARQMEDADVQGIVSNLPAPAPISQAADAAARGTLTDDEWAAEIARVKGFATGGAVNNPWESPQSQKNPTPEEVAAQQQALQAQQSQQGRQGAPLSQDWFETYGSGPEHLFLGDRTVKLSDYWGPQHPGAVPPVQQGYEGSWLPAAGILGLSAYDEWKKRRAEGEDASQQAFWQSMHDSAANTADTDAWVNQQLEDYGNNTPMPVMNDDGSISYLQPNQFWADMHRSAMDTSNTDAWVNQQLEDYRTDMARPVMNDDGTISYVDSEGNPISPSSEGFTLGRAWQGLGGAYSLYSGLEEGDTEGYIKAAEGIRDLYNAYTGSAGGLGALDIYTGIQEGGVQGYTQAAGGALQAANTLGLSTGAVGSTVSQAIPLIGAAFSAYGAYESAKVADKKGAVAQGAAAGAAIGSVIPGIGTAIGAVVGALVGLVGASLGDKQQASESYYGAHKNLKPDEMIRGWTADQVNGAVFETIKSHTKSGNVNRFKDVAEMYTAFGITKDAQKNYKNVQTQMGDFIKGVVQTAQQMGSLPTDPNELKQLDGQQIYYKVIVPAMAAKYKETTGKDAEGWTTDKVTAGSNSEMHALMADWTDWMTSHWASENPATIAALQASRASVDNGAGLGMGRVGGGQIQERARGGLVGKQGNIFDYNPRSGALSLVS